ncbi:uncharacterized protein [Cherax quadricarinatus]|uniref:uncharacterized protein isoform X2 n=1 Tax=Cherax quadricarinatus TaxID=27406 RepID=UPI002378E1BD|nr:uncharacterized protein LOC128690634 isoform X2 [Cherax quadricarinatus]
MMPAVSHPLHSSTNVKMKLVLLMTLVGLGACQFFPRRQIFDRFPPKGGPELQGSGGRVIDDSHGGSAYYFSWRHDGGRMYTGIVAARLCTRLGDGWQPLAISSLDELKYIYGIIARERLDYIWTGGLKSGSGFKWVNGEPFTVTDWSHTGGLRRPQPDNREDGRENCLAILNNFYGDGIKWHDVACHHEKPVICELRA